MTDISNTSNSFQRFITEAPAHQAVWLQAVQGLGAASTLDAKTQCPVYIGILPHCGLKAVWHFMCWKPKRMAQAVTISSARC